MDGGAAPPPTEHAAVFDHFRVAGADRPASSCYRWAPVYPTTVAGRAAVIKRTVSDETDAAAVAGWTRDLAARGVAVVTPLPVEPANPVLIGADRWVAYPFVAGRPYDGSPDDLATAGDLLGRLHAAGSDVGADLPAFDWPDPDPDSIAEDVDGLTAVFAAHAPDLGGAALTRLTSWLRAFPTETLPAVRDADLPVVAVSADFRASNLVWTPDGPVLVDPDGAERWPRLLDLALAALLFHTEAPTAPARLFTATEWATFVGAYTQHVRLTGAERARWPTALRYLLLEWGVWVLIDAGETDGEGWHDPHQRRYLVDLATVDPERFPLP